MNSGMTHNKISMRGEINQRGFTLLIAVLTASVVIAIGLALLGVTQKQVQLAGITIQSEIAFQAANAGLECTRYHDVSSSNGDSFDVPGDGSAGALASPICFGGTPTSVSGTAESGSAQVYTWTWQENSACSSVSIYKFYDENDPTPVEINGVSYRESDCPAGVECTVVRARGYNQSCSQLTTEGTVERELTAIY